jgi:hypothetical protein
MGQRSVRIGEHGRRSNDHLSDSPQDGSQGRPPCTPGESAENLSDSMSGYRGGGRRRKRPSVERPLTDTLALEASDSTSRSHTEPIEALMAPVSLEFHIENSRWYGVLCATAA